MRLTKTSSRITLQALQVIFYLLFVFLWLKDNFPPLRKWHVSPLLPLVGLLIITALRLALGMKTAKPKFAFKPGKTWGALVLIILLASAVRVPYLVHNYGLMDSDEAIPSLQGKHIAEGRLPPIYYYGALFQGSFPQFYQALLFKIFGYSALLTKVAAYLAFVAFLVVQFFLLMECFSWAWAFVIGLFYCLPLTYLLQASLDVGSHFPVVFFLGILILALTFQIYWKGQDTRLATLGVIMGLGFWTHQITTIFIATSGVFLLARYKLDIRKYLKLALFFFVGAFPVVMSEIYWKFPLVRLLFGGESGAVSESKIARAKNFLLTLISSGPEGINWIYLALIAAGTVILARLSLKKKKVLPSSLYVVYFLVYAAVYLISQFSAVPVIRYLYILYIVLPVLFAAVFMLIRTKIRYAAAALFFLLLFLLSNGKTSLAYTNTVKERHDELGAVMAAMSETKEKYWLADYWISYLMNSLSKENFIVASTTTERYPYYRLLFDSEAAHSNYLFLRDTPQAEEEAVKLTGLLDKCGITYRTKEVGRWLLVHGIQEYIYLKDASYPPQEIPEVVLENVRLTETGLDIEFARKGAAPTGGFRVDAEIPGFCSRFTPLSQAEKTVVHMPPPPQDHLKIRYSLNYQGLPIESTFREGDHVLPRPAFPFRREPVDYLTGLGPREKVSGKNWLVCAKEARLRINAPLRDSAKIVFTLFSPLKLNIEDFWWHRDFSQEVAVFVNGQLFAQTKLNDGENAVAIDCRFPPFQDGENIITLKFKYALVLSQRFDHWKTAAFLENIKMD
jgi:hypothetical protein